MADFKSKLLDDIMFGRRPFDLQNCIDGLIRVDVSDLKESNTSTDATSFTRPKMAEEIRIGE